MDLFRGEASSFTNYDTVAVLVPLEHGTGTDSEFLTDFGRDGDLTLCGEFRMGERHGDILPW
jgi:hypothetical protein